jgi:hypothetical protein
MENSSNMLSFRSLVATAAASLLVASPVYAETPLRVRGVVTEVDNGTITVKQRDGDSVTLRTGIYTTYAYVVPSSLDAIKSFQITVPPTAPITRFEVAGRSAVAIGSTVFIKTNPGDQAGLVAVGKRVTPPM